MVGLGHREMGKGAGWRGRLMSDYMGLLGASEVLLFQRWGIWRGGDGNKDFHVRSFIALGGAAVGAGLRLRSANLDSLPQSPGWTLGTSASCRGPCVMCLSLKPLSCQLLWAAKYVEPCFIGYCCFSFCTFCSQLFFPICCPMPVLESSLSILECLGWPRFKLRSIKKKK